MFLGMARHDENAPGALENKDAINVEEAVPEEMLGDDQTRHYKKGMWTVSELQVLQAVRREDFERQSKGGNREKHSVGGTGRLMSGGNGWRIVAGVKGYSVSAGQCQDKWEGITAGFKKVNDYEKQLPLGGTSYWQLGSDEKKRMRLPPNFHKEVFMSLQEWYVKSRTGEPGILFDSLAPPRGAASNMELSGSVGDESDENDIVDPTLAGKRRRVGGSKSAGFDRLAEVLERNNKTMVDALRLSEDRKDNRHRQTMQFEREKHKDLYDLQMKLGNGYIGALNRIGSALDQIAMAMQGTSHP